MRHLPVVEWRAWSRVPRKPAVLCEGWRFEFDLHGEVKWCRFRGNGLPEVGEMGEAMTKKTNKPTKAAKKPAKRKSARDLPVKAWEKLKGRGPFPQVAVDSDVRKRMKKM